MLLLPHTPHHHITKGLLAAISLTKYIIFGSQEKNNKAYQRTKNTFEETEQASELDMAGILELSDQEFRATMINMLRAPTDKIDSI